MSPPFVLHSPVYLLFSPSPSLVFSTLFSLHPLFTSSSSIYLSLPPSCSLYQPILNQAGLPQGPSDQKVVVVTVDNCDTSVALRFGHVIGNYSCSAQGSQSGSKK